MSNDSTNAILLVSQNIICDIYSSFSNSCYESGGLIGSKEDNVIDSFYYDKGKEERRHDYIPNVDELQHQLSIWNKEQIEFRGIIHSHLRCGELSQKDVNMARRVLELNNIPSILMPIYIINKQIIVWYEVLNDNIVLRVPKTTKSGGR
ncbi:hypothetical protein [Butyrivibrio sp. AE2032]|uniref:hypothetical protein n=1 Tax=Butyrivibrio sp. AE2032 TaxID=1458463 RepID=UPI000553D187|nr:hypothetical protein [Butyrivibrio sp. AE2032]